MFTPGLETVHYQKMRQQELMQEAQQYRLITMALKARPQKINPFFRVLVVIGKGLVLVGERLEVKFDGSPQTEAHLAYNSSSSHGC